MIQSIITGKNENKQFLHFSIDAVENVEEEEMKGKATKHLSKVLGHKLTKQLTDRKPTMCQ